MNKFYVYAILDPRKPGNFVYKEFLFDHEPFYIGKGCCSRMYCHTCRSELNRDRNPHKSRKIKKILAAGKEIIVLKIRFDMPEDDAYRLEEKAIKTIGRKNTDRRFPLTNIDKGGRTAPSLTATQRKKMSKTIKRQFRSGERIHPWVGRKHTKESIKKMKDNHSLCWIGRKHTPESKDKIGKANQGKRHPERCNTYRLTSPNGTLHIVSKGLKYFCREHSLYLPLIRKVIRGTRRHHKGWLAEKILTVNPGI